MPSPLDEDGKKARHMCLDLVVHKKNKRYMVTIKTQTIKLAKTNKRTCIIHVAAGLYKNKTPRSSTFL